MDISHQPAPVLTQRNDLILEATLPRCVQGRKTAAHVNVSYVQNKLYLIIFIYTIWECVRAFKKAHVSLRTQVGACGRVDS